jgi:hypothetical protein
MLSMRFVCPRCLQPYDSEPWGLDAWGGIVPEESHCPAYRRETDLWAEEEPPC